MKQHFGRIFFKISFWLIACLGILLPQLLLFPQLKVAQKDVSRKAYAKHRVKNMKLYFFEGNQKSWVVHAEEAKSAASEEWVLEKVKGRYLGKGTVSFSGDRGWASVQENSLRLEGNVEAQSSNFYNFETEEVFFKKAEESTKFYSSLDVKLFNKKERLEVFSKGIEGDLKTGKLNLLSEVRCHKYVKKYSDVYIQSDKAEVTSSLKSIRFKENLVVTQEKLRVKGKEAHLIYDDKKNTLKSVRVNGDIFASDGIKTATSENVEMRLDEDVIIFHGSPRIKMGKNEMVGEEILILNKQRNIQVRKGSIKATQKGPRFKDD